MRHPIRAARLAIKRRRLERLRRQATELHAAMPSRQLRRQAERRAHKILGR
jgi:hypothetical protein